MSYLSFLVAGMGFEPHDLRVMSPTSYQAALPRDIMHRDVSHLRALYYIIQKAICQHILEKNLKILSFIFDVYTFFIGSIDIFKKIRYNISARRINILVNTRYIPAIWAGASTNHREWLTTFS